MTKTTTTTTTTMTMTMTTTTKMLRRLVRGRRWSRAGVAMLMLTPATTILATTASSPVDTVAAAPGDIGFQGPSYVNNSGAPSGEKPESKLWWNDGSWWGSLWADDAREHHVFRLDLDAKQWVDTGVVLDPRRGSKADVLWDGSKLYVASHVYSQSAAAGTPGRLYRYSYHSSTKSYSLDAGFPVSINDWKTETLVIDKDSTGQLWATWTQPESSCGCHRVMVNRTLGSDQTWGTPFVLPISGVSASGGALKSDDISSVIAFGGDRIGIMWSNQNTSAMYFAVHDDSNSDISWTTTRTAIQGPNEADDHINLKSLQSDGSGRVFAAVKSSHSSSSAPLNRLLVRDAATGDWTSHTFGWVSDHHTRPIIMLDTTAGRLHMLATADENGGTIYRKTTPLSSISFAQGLGDPFIEEGATPGTSGDLNNATSTKQNVNSTTGLVVLATNDTTDRYWWNFDPLGGQPSGTTTTTTATTTTSPTTTNPGSTTPSSTVPPSGSVSVSGPAVTATGTGATLDLEPWAPASGDLMVVQVARRNRNAVPVVSGNGASWSLVADVHNIQGIGAVSVFTARATSAATAGAVRVSLAGNASPVSVVAQRFTGADVGATRANPGPIVDDANMLDTLVVGHGSYVLGAGWHRNRTFTVPAGETPIATNVTSGTGGDTTRASMWYEGSTAGGAVQLGAPGDLSGAHDWALILIELRPNGASSPSTTTTTTAPSTTTTTTPTATTTTTVVPTTTTSPTTTIPTTQPPGAIGLVGGASTVSGSGPALSIPVTAGANEMLLVQIVRRDASKPVSVTGLSTAWQNAKVTNVQNVGAVELYWTKTGAGGASGTINVSIAGNTKPAAVILQRFTGVASVDGVRVHGGPVVDDADMLDTMADVDAGAWVVAAGWHRTKVFSVPAGETAIATNVVSGSGGDQTRASMWYEPSSRGAASLQLGAPGDLSGAHDWALILVELVPGV